MRTKRFHATTAAMGLALVSAWMMTAQTRVTSNGCVRNGDMLTCPPPSQMTNVPRQQQPVADPEQMAREMNISANLSTEQLYQWGARVNASRQYAQAAAIFWTCSNLGDARCATALGLMYQQGRGVAVNVERELKYIGIGAAAGNRGAEYTVGVWYDDGEVLPHDAAKAFSWYMRSAQHNFATAQTRVGIAYEFGDGTARSRATAIQWLMKAAMQGDGFSRVLADTLRNPRTPARFRDEDALAAYMRGISTAAIARAWPKVPASGGISKAIDDQERKRNAGILEATGRGSEGEQCRNGGSCPHQN